MNKHKPGEIFLENDQLNVVKADNEIVPITVDGSFGINGATTFATDTTLDKFEKNFEEKYGYSFDEFVKAVEKTNPQLKI